MPTNNIIEPTTGIYRRHGIKPEKYPERAMGEAVTQWNRVHRWTPNPLRHTFATKVRRERGLEDAQVLLGHAKADITPVYAERDEQRAIETIRMIG